MEAIEELFLFSAGIIAIVIALPFFISSSSSFSQSFSGDATALQLANNFHLDNPIIYNGGDTEFITNFGPAIRLKVEVSENGGTSSEKIVNFITGQNGLTLLTPISKSQTEEIKIYSLSGELLQTYEVQIINSNLFSLSDIGAGTKVMINSQVINFTPINNNLTFALPTGSYNFTVYSPYFYNSSVQTISSSTPYDKILPSGSSLSTYQIKVEQVLPNGNDSPLSLAVLNINYNSSIAKSNTSGIASFQYVGSNSIYINASCPLNTCAGRKGDISNNYTSISKYYSSIPSEILLYPKFKTNVDLTMICKITTSSSQKIQYIVPITISNNQNVQTGIYQQMINISESDYSSYINYSGSTANFELMYPNNTHIPAWIMENDSGKIIVYAKLNNIPANSSTTVDLIFLNKSVNTLSSSGSSGIGEAPELSSTYAEYDDGAGVFNNYWNFNGTSLPSGWINNGMTVKVNDGVTLTPDENTADWSRETITYANTNFYGQSYILESYTKIITLGNSDIDPALIFNSNSETAYNDNYTIVDSGIDLSGSTPTYDHDTQETQGSMTVTGISMPSGYSYSNFNIYQDYVNGATIGLGVNYSPIINSQTNYNPSTQYIGIGSWIGSGSPTTITYWFLTQTYPPNGIMPSVSFGAVLKGNQNLTTTSSETAPTSGVVDFINSQNQTLSGYISVGPSGKGSLWLPSGSYNVEATSFTNLIYSGNFTSKANNQSEEINFNSSQPCQ